MPIPNEELEIRTGESARSNGGGEGRGVLRVDGVLDVPGELEVGVDVLYAGFVKSKIGFSQGESVGGDEGLAFLTGWEIEGRWEGCGRSVDGG
jgi:hypothetical protein